MIPSLGQPGSQAPAPLPGVDNARLLKEAARTLVVVDKAPGKLPALLLGEALSARVVERLADDRLAVLIKNSLFTLKLPAGVSVNGETLALKVVSLAPTLTLALQPATADGGENGSVAVRLSNATQYLSGLLRLAPQASDKLPTLLPDPQAPPAERAAALAQTIKDSGVFYEASQKAWVEGKLPLERVQAQPQAQLGEQLKAQPGAHAALSAELGAVLSRQLDTLETRSLTVNAFAWPGQPAQLQIEREAGNEREGDGAEALPVWTTRLNLELPALGSLGARLRLVGNQVQLTLDTDAPTAERVAAHRDRLQLGLEAAGLLLTALNTRQP